MKLKEDFINDLDSIQGVTCSSSVDLAIEKLTDDEEERAQMRRVFDNTMRALCAKSTEEVDLSLEDLIECFRGMGFFQTIFEGPKAAEVFRGIQSALKNAKTQRTRRVL